MILSQRDLATAFSVDPRTIRNWEERGLDVARVPDTGKAAEYDLTKAIEWRIDSVQSTVDDEYRVARTRVATAKAEEAERKNAEAMGALIPMDDVEALLREEMMSIDATLRHAPARFVSDLAGRCSLTLKEARVLLDDMVELVRGAIRRRETGPDGPDDQPPHLVA